MSTQTARIRTVEPLAGFVLRLTFDDGSEREVGLEDDLWGPVFEPLRANPDLFRQVQVDEELGTIVWPNGADMDPDVLHSTSSPRSLLRAASRLRRPSANGRLTDDEALEIHGAIRARSA